VRALLERAVERMAAEELVALSEAALTVVPEAAARELLLTRLVMDRPERSAVEFVQSYMAADDPHAAALVSQLDALHVVGAVYPPSRRDHVTEC
jgi:hypothetical protein